MQPFVTTIFAETEIDTARAATALARDIAAPYFITLRGDVGAGKTVWARAFIRALMGDEGLDVISPTYPLLQIYESPKGIIYHYDLYRLEDQADAEMTETIRELSWDDAMAHGITLVEWSEKLPLSLAKPHLSVHLIVDKHHPTKRKIEITRHA